VIEGNGPFFAVTKRVHNRLQDYRGDEGGLGDAEAATYEDVMAGNAAHLVEMVGPGDVVILHDPQALGLASRLRARGAGVIWRCHIGADWSSELTDEAWSFLRRWTDDADLVVFSRASYAPGWMDPSRVAIIAPA